MTDMAHVQRAGIGSVPETLRRLRTSTAWIWVLLHGWHNSLMGDGTGTAFNTHPAPLPPTRGSRRMSRHASRLRRCAPAPGISLHLHAAVNLARKLAVSAGLAMGQRSLNEPCIEISINNPPNLKNENIFHKICQRTSSY
jgi:hypothetical protein